MDRDKHGNVKRYYKEINLNHYGSYSIRGGYGSGKEKVVTFRIDSELNDRIENFLEKSGERGWYYCWNRGELIRAALTLFLDAWEHQKKLKGKKEGEKKSESID